MRLLLLICTVLLLNSCYSPRYAYSPSVINVPQFDKKGDSKLAAYYSTGTGGLVRSNHDFYSRGIDLQGAYAFSKNWAVMANKFLRWEKNGSDNAFFTGDKPNLHYKRDLNELGVGFFRSAQNGNGLHFQLFGGFAFGEFDINETNVDAQGVPFNKFHYSHITKVFLQPAVLFGQGKSLSGSFSSRVSMVTYSNIRTDYTPGQLTQYLLADLSTMPVYFWEPAMNYSFEFGKASPFRFELQTGFAVLLNTRFIDYRSLNVAMGIVADLTKLHKKTKAIKRA